MAARVIAHLDMDAFYASVELLRYPELRGQPVVIGGRGRYAPQPLADPPPGAPRYRFARLRDYAGRGVATTATYEARALGVNSAMGLMKAAARAPDAVLLPADFDQYRRYSRLFKEAVAALASTIEDRGIDEIYIDLSDVVAARLGDREGADPADAEAELWWCAREVGRNLKQAVRNATGLSCTVGLAPNKLVAKLASELGKPDGLLTITQDEVASRLWPLPVRRLHGVGPKAELRLQKLGIATIGELAQAEAAQLAPAFGAHYAQWLQQAARGIDWRPVETDSEPKSVSRETTFERDLHAKADRAQLSQIFTGLCERVAEDLRRKGVAGRTIGIKLRFADFATVTRDQTLPAPTADAATIRRTAGLCLKRVDLKRRIRLLGVRVGTLSHAA